MTLNLREPPQQQPVDPNTPLTVTLTAVEWHNIRVALGKLTYEDVAQTIASLVQQLQTGARLAQAAEQTPQQPVPQQPVT